MLKRTAVTTPDGFAFEELDYSIQNHFSSALVVEIDNYFIMLRCDAESESDLAEMDRSVLAMKHVS